MSLSVSPTRDPCFFCHLERVTVKVLSARSLLQSISVAAAAYPYDFHSSRGGSSECENHGLLVLVWVVNSEYVFICENHTGRAQSDRM